MSGDRWHREKRSRDRSTRLGGCEVWGGWKRLRQEVTFSRDAKEERKKLFALLEKCFQARDRANGGSGACGGWGTSFH